MLLLLSQLMSDTAACTARKASPLSACLQEPHEACGILSNGNKQSAITTPVGMSQAVTIA